MDRELEAIKAVLAPVPKAARLIDEERRTFRPDQAGAWSSGELLLVDVAAALWKGRGEVDLGDLVNRLDDDWLFAVLKGIAIYRGRALPGFGPDGSVHA